MIKSIYYAKKIIERQVRNKQYEMIDEVFSKYQKGYYWTNENIDYYLKLANLKNTSKALTVTSTGDHTFNLIYHGINNIDTFDINNLTEYFALGLKRAMIIEYNYFEFINMINYIADPYISLEQLTDIINNLTYNMERKHQIFWRQIIDYNYKLQKKTGTNLNLIHMLYIGVYAKTTSLNNNSYLQDEYSYENFRLKLIKANISFKNCDALDLSNAFKDKKYDLILLSNILDYVNSRWGNNWGYNELYGYIKSLDCISNQDAVIFLKYIISYIDNGKVKDHIFHNSIITSEDFQDSIYEVPKHTTSSERDGIILRRVKIDK